MSFLATIGPWLGPMGYFNGRLSTDQVYGHRLGQRHVISEVVGRNGLPLDRNIFELMKSQGFFDRAEVRTSILIIFLYFFIDSYIMRIKHVVLGSN